MVRTGASTAGGPSSIPDTGTKIPQTIKKKKKICYQIQERPVTHGFKAIKRIDKDQLYRRPRSHPGSPPT